eukprot:gb/GEZN01023131.1/.p1 GENE.gb/GEZN01023131.1/~~gb/GEZN01023131.1/.p1  ORF type:complete len:151 (-),score=21.33 gb/GEZN01023131.1/:121-573(-)
MAGTPPYERKLQIQDGDEEATHHEGEALPLVYQMRLVRPHPSSNSVLSVVQLQQLQTPAQEEWEEKPRCLVITLGAAALLVQALGVNELVSDSSSGAVVWFFGMLLGLVFVFLLQYPPNDKPHRLVLDPVHHMNIVVPGQTFRGAALESM